ncbi:DUF302 domain-containing protein [Kribbella pittospori]|uniref:DUF302 domain-containing protein n=1 Tax=Kribbella pittospori TaxID=722689 RepID=A0A4R0K4J5_9ACTN|nr:DUF302 domain-containing protein [Kribbella pittospori]TCC54961.1 DUF302 domain-containing protein [Kribbella pittospori]
MAAETKDRPAGVRATAGVVHKRSPVSVAETVLTLSAAIRAAGAIVLFVVDHSGEAERVGSKLRDTKLLGFGNPSEGTPIMEASPVAALDLPLKILVWADDDDAVWMSCADPDWLAERHGLDDEFAAALSTPVQVITQVASMVR